MKDVTKRFLTLCEYLIERKKEFTLADLIQKIGISRSLITEMKKGRSNVGLSTIQNTVKFCPELSVEWILTGKGQMLKEDVVSPALELKNTHNIVMIDVNAAAVLPGNLHNSLYYRELPSFTLPGKKYETGNFICLQIEGDTMHPTIKNNEWIIGQEVEDINFESGYIYLVVTFRSVFCKRLYHKKNSDYIELISDNDEIYTPQIIHKSEIQRIYQASDKITNDFRNWEADIKRNLSVLEAEIAQIKNDLSNLKK